MVIKMLARLKSKWTQWEFQHRDRKYKNEPFRGKEYNKTKQKTLDSIKIRLEDIQEWISNMEGRVVEIIQNRKKKRF